MSGRLWIALATLVALSHAAAAAPLMAGGDAPPLAAWSKLCIQTPAECAVDTFEPETVAATSETLELIEAVNRHVNRTIQAVTDQELWNTADVWGYPVDGKGDCEDFQLLKRRYLAAAGIPRRAMRMTVVLNELGEGHAVLTIRTDKDDLILDNRINTILRWNETGYTFIKRESAMATGWDYLKPRTEVLAIAQ